MIELFRFALSPWTLAAITVALICIVLILLWWLRRRDEHYLKRSLEEVVSDDVRKLINKPVAGETPSFVQKINSTTHKASYEILERQNQDNV